MITKLLSLLFLTASLWSLEVSFKTDDTTTKASDKEVNYMINDFKNQQINISKTNAYKLVQENRVLSNEYIKQYPFSDEKKMALRLEFEKEYANKFIVKNQEKIDLSNEILLSYYKDNIKDFIESKKINFTIYMSKTFENILPIYEKYKNNPTSIPEKFSDMNITRYQKQLKVISLHPQLKNLLKDENSTNYITAPQKFKDNYIIMRIDSFENEGYITFSKMKQYIAKKLQEKNFRESRAALVKKYIYEEK